MWDGCWNGGWKREKEREGRNMYVIFGSFQKQERDGKVGTVAGRCQPFLLISMYDSVFFHKLDTCRMSRRSHADSDWPIHQG